MKNINPNRVYRFIRSTYLVPVLLANLVPALVRAGGEKDPAAVLPVEVFRLILKQLPSKDYENARRISKSWNNATDDDCLYVSKVIEKHINKLCNDINETECVLCKETLHPIHKKLVKLIGLGDNLISSILKSSSVPFTEEGKELIRQNILETLGSYYEALLNKLPQENRTEVEKLIDMNPASLLESSTKIEKFLAPSYSVSESAIRQAERADQHKYCTNRW